MLFLQTVAGHTCFTEEVTLALLFPVYANTRGEPPLPNSGRTSRPQPPVHLLIVCLSGAPRACLWSCLRGAAMLPHLEWCGGDGRLAWVGGRDPVPCFSSSAVS